MPRYVEPHTMYTVSSASSTSAPERRAAAVSTGEAGLFIADVALRFPRRETRHASASRHANRGHLEPKGWSDAHQPMRGTDRRGAISASAGGARLRRRP